MSSYEHSNSQAQSEQKPPALNAVIGIGASAGGLEALTQLLRNIEPPLNAAIVIVQHISADHRSLLRDLLARETTLNVVTIKHLQAIEPNQLYITPANANVELVDGKFHLTKPQPEAHPKPSINLFLTSLANNYAEQAIAIILSGTGSDGVEGCSAVKQAGGIVIVQQPDTAKYAGMPLSALEGGQVDQVLSAAEIGAELTHTLAGLNQKTTFLTNNAENAELVMRNRSFPHVIPSVKVARYPDLRQFITEKNYVHHILSTS